MTLLAVLGVLVVGFFFFELAGYAIHRMLHFKWTGPLNQAHMAHHLKHYPPEDYLSTTYRRAGTKNTVLLFLPFALTVAALITWLIPLWLSIPLLLEMGLVGWLNDYMHDSLHIEGHPLERRPYFRLLRLRHFQHHVDMSRNYGIVTFFADRLTGTFKER